MAQFSKPTRKRPRRSALRWIAPLLAALASGWWLVRPSPAEWRSLDLAVPVCGEAGGARACAIDGDTVAIGFGREARRVRLTGFDAPELDGPCAGERAAAVAARSELSRWLSAGRFTWDGGTDPPRDRYGRELRAARRGDAQLAEHMVARGFASDSGWGAQAIDWCAAR